MPETVRVVLTPVAGARRTATLLSAVEGVSEVVTPDLEDVPGALGNAEILVTFRWSDDWIVPGLRWLQSYTAGMDQFPLDRLHEEGVIVTSAVGIHDVQVSEHAFGLLLGLTRGIGVAARNQTTHTWKWPRVVDLAGMTMGILGLGVIGEAIARKAKAFEMKVVGTKRSPDAYAGVADEVLGPEGTLEVCRRADVVVIALPGSAETTGTVGAAELAALEGGYLINVGRGSVVDQPSLIEALESGSLRGAGLDVFAEEPLPADSPLWDLPGVLITPHVAGASPHYGDRLVALFARNLEAYLGRGEWVNRVV